MTALIDFPKDSVIKIDSINASRSVVKRLAGIGLVKKTIVEIVQSEKSNSLILVKVAQRRIAIRRTVAQTILGTRV